MNNKPICERHHLFEFLTYKKCVFCGFKIEPENKQGKLVLLGTEIGNPFDVTPRVIDALETTDYILCEHEDSFGYLVDTMQINISDKTVIYGYDLLSDQNSDGLSNLNKLYDEMLSGKNAVMIADQGMPLIMDPGDHIVKGAIRKNIPVTCFPGPSAPITAINLSGFTVWDFVFLGNLPSQPEEKDLMFEKMKSETKATVFFDKDIYILQTLEQLSNIVGGGKRIALCFNMTRDKENIVRGTVDEVISWLLNNGYDKPREDAEWLLMLSVVVEGLPRGPHI